MERSSPRTWSHRLNLSRRQWTARYFDRAGVGIARRIEGGR